MSEYTRLMNSYIGGLMNTISDLYDKYPRVLFPERFWDSLLAFKNSISDSSILGECRKIKGDYSYLYPLREPRKPTKPCLSEVSTTYLKPYKKLSVKLYELFDFLVFLYAIIMGFMPYFIIVVILSALGLDIEQYSWLYIFLCILVFIVFYIHYYNKINGKIRTETYYKRIPYSEEELIVLKQKEQERYEQALAQYPSQVKRYKELLKSYENDIKQQEDTVFQTIPLIVASKVTSLLQESSSYSVVDDAPKRGRSENRLFAALMNTIPNDVHVDTTVAGYYPDLMISTSNNIYIDVEIDEPYDMDTKKEIHYLGCDDEERNSRICNEDWFVVRFSEKQVITNCDACVRIIKTIKAFIETGDRYYLDNIYNDIFGKREKRWTKEEARLMAINHYRETY